MNKLEKYKKIRQRLEFVAFLLALISGNIISSYLGITSSKFISFDTAVSLAIVLVIAFILNIIFERIADSWYTKTQRITSK